MLERIVNLIRRPPSKIETSEPSLEQLVSILRRETYTLERLGKSDIALKRFETIYRLDPLIFAAINKLTRLITSPPIQVIEGSEEDRNTLLNWIKRIDLQNKLEDIVRDVLIYGFSLSEIEYNEDKTDIINLRLLDPKTVDFIKTRKGMDEIALDVTGQIKGYTIQIKGKTEDLPRNNALHIKFFSLGDKCLGISLIEPIFKMAWIRLNLEEALGEAVYRHGFPIYYFNIGDEKVLATPAKVKEAKKLLKNLDTAAELILPNWIKPGVLRGGGGLSEKLAELLIYFTGAIASGLEIPKSFWLPGRVGRAAAEVENLDFERTVVSYQQRLIKQLEEQLINKYIILKQMKTKPRIVFQEMSPEHRLLRIRTLAMLSHRGLLTKDIHLENQLRRELDLPELQVEETKIETYCVFDHSMKCPIRTEYPISIKDLALYCNICSYRKQSNIKGENIDNTKRKNNRKKR